MEFVGDVDTGVCPGFRPACPLIDGAVNLTVGVTLAGMVAIFVGMAVNIGEGAGEGVAVAVEEDTGVGVGVCLFAGVAADE